jgi:hypothetical protein
MTISNKERYIQFCVDHPDIPIFSQPWWLDAVCPDSWDVILIERNDKIIASFPYHKVKTRKQITYIGMPPLTQKLGPYIVYDSNKNTENKKIGYEHEIYNEIIDKLPKYDIFTINFDWKYKNWLPFYWKGYRQTTRYTYILDNIKDHEYIYTQYKIQKIQKAKKVLTFHTDLSKEIFYSYFSDVVKERGDTISFSRELFYQLCNMLYDHNAGRLFYCIDSEKNIHAINLTIWDNECAYYLSAMRKKEYNTSGGTEFLVDETIKYVSQFVNRFDFEGSMIKGVEESYRYYGTRQTEYYNIYKCNNPIIRILRAIKDI